jgi:hypothetical protein
VCVCVYFIVLVLQLRDEVGDVQHLRLQRVERQPELKGAATRLSSHVSLAGVLVVFRIVVIARFYVVVLITRISLSLSLSLSRSLSLSPVNKYQRWRFQ